MTIGTRVYTICTVDDNGVTIALGTIGEVIKDHCGDTMYRIDYDEGGYDFMYPFEFNIIDDEKPAMPEASATYRVYFTDAHDGYPNQKLIQTDYPEDISGYMVDLGHTDIEYEMASCTLGGERFDLSVRIDRILLEALATICSCALNKTVIVNDLPKMYRIDPICHHEINHIIKGVE